MVQIHRQSPSVTAEPTRPVFPHSTLSVHTSCDCPGFKGHLHTFRHTFISHAISSGIPAEVVRGIVGHVDDDILKLYTHIADNRKQSAIERFENATDGPSNCDRSEANTDGTRPPNERDQNDVTAQD